MIGIKCYSPSSIQTFLPQVGIKPEHVIMNPRSSEGLKVIVHVGAFGVRKTHCYVSMEANLPYITCLDPATVHSEPENRMFILCALAKAKAINEGNFEPPHLAIYTAPTFAQAAAFVDRALSSDLVSIDLETDPSTTEITTLGLAFEHAGVVESMSIPLAAEHSDYWMESEEQQVWGLFYKLLSSPVDKLFQNFIFDTMILSYFGIRTEGRIFDTMTAAHWIQPELRKSLADLARLYLMCDTWKDNGSWVSNESLWQYNAKDAGLTLLIYKKQKELLQNENRFTFFEQQLTPLSTEVLRICERGWVLDPKALHEMRSALEDEIGVLLANLVDFAKDFIRPKISYKWVKHKIKPTASYVVGVGNPDPTSKHPKYTEFRALDPTGLKNFRDIKGHVFEVVSTLEPYNPASPIQLLELLRSLGVKVPTKYGKESTSELSMLKLLDNPKIDESVKEKLIRPTLRFRKKSKMLSTYCNVKQDFDGRTRFSITIPGTVEGRFSSKRTPWETGLNSQNIPKSFRKVSIPHYPDWVIVNIDFKQADPHMVAWLSGEAQMLKILQDPKGDLHSHTASGIFARDITKDIGFNKDTSRERKLGKACNNGLNYGMGVNKFRETCHSQGLILTYTEAQQIYDAYFALYPGIRNWQESIRTAINRTRTLTTPFGRRRYFYGHISEKLYNEAYAYIAPTTVADALNAGWLKTVRLCKHLRFEVLQQCHDSMKFQCHLADLPELCTLVKQAYKEVKFQVNGRVCNFPIEIEYGPNWGKLTAWKE